MNTTRPESPLEPNTQTLFNASAGSGKTFNLVYHYLSKCFSNYKRENIDIPFRNLLAVTFTIKAAAEMRKRILTTLAAFRDFGEKPLSSTDQQMAEMIAQQFGMQADELRTVSKRILGVMLHFYNMVSVGTIDKFTHGVVRSFAQDLNLNPDFDVEMDTGSIVEKSVRQLINQVGREDRTELSQSLVEQVLEALSEGTSWNVEALLTSEARSLTSDVDRSYASVLSELPDEQWRAFIARFKAYTKQYRDEAKRLGDQLAELIGSVGLKPVDFSHKTPDKLIRDLRSNDITTLSKINRGARFIALEEGNFFSKKDESKFSPLAEPIRDDLISIFSQIREHLNRSAYVKFVLQAQRSLNGLRFLGHVEKELELIRKNENTVLISDFNRLISENLADQPEAFIYERIGERYSHYFIDEFQDTSSLQWSNITPLVENALATNGTVMLVGDAKQSIYRFRGAEVGQFVDIATGEPVYSRSGTGGLSVRYNREIRQLPMNYRSLGKIVDFNNHVVKSLANHFDNAPDYAQIYEMGTQKAHHPDKGYVAIREINPQEEQSTMEAYCHYVLSTIQEALSRGFYPKDIAVLTRKNKQASELAVFLSKHISVVGEDSLNAEASPEVKLLLAAMRYQRNPKEGVFQAQLIQWLLDTQRLTPALADEGYRAVREDVFLQWLQNHTNYRLEDYWIALPPVEWVDLLTVSLEVDFDPYVLKFIDEAFQYQQRMGEGQVHFIDYATEHLGTWSIEVERNRDAVTVSTIHKSKGLEYEIVILPFVGWETTSNFDRIWLNTKDIEPFGELPHVKAAVNSIGEIPQFQEEYRSWMISNTMDHSNLLYVAVTRAKKELYIAIDDPEKKGVRDNSASVQYRNALISHPDLKQVDKGMWELGEPLRISDEEQSSSNGGNSNERILKPGKVSHWRDRIQIAPKRSKSWDEQRSERDMGIAIHRVLAEINQLEDIQSALDEMQLNGELNSNDRQAIEARLLQVENRDVLKEIFHTDAEVRSERAILDIDGQSYRPDRILIYPDNRARVIDFKTGTPRDTHRDQIRRYAHLLVEMGYKTTEAELVYIGEDEISIENVNLQ